jgi:hypothetical protein
MSPPKQITPRDAFARKQATSATKWPNFHSAVTELFAGALALVMVTKMVVVFDWLGPVKPFYLAIAFSIVSVRTVAIVQGHLRAARTRDTIHPAHSIEGQL